jgi:hypothetical protein
MVPPTSKGTRPRAVIAAIAAQRVGTEAGRRVGFLRADQVDQVMREFGQGCRVGFGGADMSMSRKTCAESTLISSTGKRRDKFERHRGLAAGGRSHQQDCRRQNFRVRCDLAHRPRRKWRSRSVMLNCVQVGRPWLQ